MRLRTPAALGLALALLLSVRHAWPGFLNANESIRYFFLVSLVEYRQLSIDAPMAYYKSHNVDRAERAGASYLDKAPGASILGVPYYLFWTRVLHPELPRPPPFPVHGLFYGLTLACCLLPVILAALALRRALRRSGFASDAMAAALVLGLLVCTPLGLYATLYFGHAPAAAALALGFAFLEILPLRPGLAGLAAGAAVAFEYTTFPLAALLAGFALVRGRFPALFRFVLGALPIGGALAIYHTLAFGGPFRTGYQFKANPALADIHAHGVLGFGMPKLAALWGITLSRQRGLFFLAPWLALAVLGIVAMIRRPGLRTTGVFLALACATALLLGSSFVDWPAGACVGPRHLVQAIPFFAYAAIFAPQVFSSPGLQTAVRALGGGLALASLVQLWFPMATFPFYSPEVADPIYTVSARLLLSGHLAPGPLEDFHLAWQIAAVLPPLVVLGGGALLLGRKYRLEALGALLVGLLWVSCAWLTSPGPGPASEREIRVATSLMGP